MGLQSYIRLVNAEGADKFQATPSSLQPLPLAPGTYPQGMQQINALPTTVQQVLIFIPFKSCICLEFYEKIFQKGHVFQKLDFFEVSANHFKSAQFT